MLSPNTIFRKTEAGNVEIATRKLGLRAELRRLLIMIDGKNTVAKLAAVVRPAEIEPLLLELQASGVIDSSDGMSFSSSMSPGPSAASTTPTDSTEPTQQQFNAARNAAVRFLNDVLGPGAETMAIKIERCKNAQELRDTVTQTRASLDRMMGEATGQRFLDAVRSAAK